MITGAETAHLQGRPTAIFLEGRLPILEAPLARALGLHDGQVVRPTVEARGEQLKLVLQGAGVPRLLDMPPDLRGAPGDTLGFRVQLLPGGQAVLRPLTAGGVATAAEGLAAAGALAQPERLARLAFRPPGLDAWLQVLRPGFLSGLMQAHPQPEAQEWLQRLLRQRPGMAQLNPDSLRLGVQRTGMGLEAMLARGLGPDMGPDMADTKTVLRELMRAWTQAPASALALLGQALDDIEASQLRAVQAGLGAPGPAADTLTGREVSLAFVLPFSDADPVYVQLRRQRRQPGEEAPPFFVHLHSRSQALGEVWLQTRILDSQVELAMWAVREDIASRARQGSGDLADALDEVGLQMTGLRVIHGARPSEDAPAAPPDAGRLVDFRA